MRGIAIRVWEYLLGGAGRREVDLIRVAVSILAAGQPLGPSPMSSMGLSLMWSLNDSIHNSVGLMVAFFLSSDYLRHVSLTQI